MIEKGAESLLQYGALGVAVVVLGFVVYKLYSKQEQTNKKIQDELTALRAEFDKYIKEDRILMLEAINNASQGFKDLHLLISTQNEKRT